MMESDSLPRRTRLAAPNSSLNPAPNHHPKTTTHHVVFGSQTIETTVTSDALTITQWVTDMLSLHRGKTVIAGLDVEWKPNRNKYINNRAATLQLCVGTKCIIIQLIYLRAIPQSLRDFLLSEMMTFVGVEVTGDVAKISREYGLACRNVRELRMAAGFGSVPRVGLKRLAMEVVGLEIEKPKNVTLSNWEVSVLSDSQVKYACGDAYASYAIGHTLSLRD